MRRDSRTTMSQHPSGRSPHLVKHLQIVGADQVWCADLTSIHLPRQFCSPFRVDGQLHAQHPRVGTGGQQARRVAQGGEAQRVGASSARDSSRGRGVCNRLPLALWPCCIQPRRRSAWRRKRTPTENASAERLMRTLKEEVVQLA